VLDAGSTGSRVHTYRFNHGTKGLALIDDTFKQLKPGLSSFKDDPQAGGASLAPLLESAMATVRSRCVLLSGLATFGTVYQRCVLSV
jgi:Golgi nucleoside diphosphatase